MIVDFLSTALNRLLLQDENLADKLHPLQEKTLTLTCLLPLPLQIQCYVDNNYVYIQRGNSRQSHASISGTPLQLFRVGLLQATSDAFQVDDLLIEGDMELAEHWLRFLREADIDIEEYLASMIGDVPANKGMMITRNIKHFFKRTLSSFQVSAQEYLHEESDWFPTREALNMFFDDVDDVRLATDRLAAKIILLKDNMKDHL